MLKRLSLIAVFCLLSTPLFAAVLPEPFQARYTVSYGSMVIGESERSLTKVGKNEYVFATHSQGTGVAALILKDRVSERSRFRLAKGEIQPLEYRYERSGGKRHKTVDVRFDWKKKRVSGRNNDIAWQVPLRPGVHDMLLYQLAASSDLQRGRKALSYRVADEGELKPYDLAIQGEETLDTALGPLRTVKLKRLDDKRDTTLWLAEELAFLPVRIEHVETDGKRFQAQIQSLTGLGRQ